MTTQASKSKNQNIQKIVILSKSAKSIEATVTFLAKRGYEVQFTTSYKELNQILFTNVVKFVFISVNHSQLDLLGIPDAAVKASQAKVILFVESSNPASFLAARKLNVPFVVGFPPSGPAFHREMLKAEQDIKTEGKSPEDNFLQLSLTRELFNAKDETLLSASEKKVAKKINDYQIVKNLNSVLFQAAQMAMDEVVKINEEATKVILIDIVKNCFAVPILSSRFNGYLLICLAQDDHLYNTALNLKQKIFQNLIILGESPSEQDLIKIDLANVKYIEWNLESAAFFLRSIHNGVEVATSFFTNYIIEPDLRSCSDEKFYEIDLALIPEECPLEFSVYLYLESNAKYVPYRMAGYAFEGDSKLRLMSSGVSNVYIKREEASQLQKTIFQKQINDHIKAYQIEKAVNSGG